MSTHRSLARLFILLPAVAAILLCQPARARQNGVAPAGETRVFHLTVADEKGNLVLGVRRESLTAFDGGERREIASFGASDVPANVMFLVDASSSAFGSRGSTRLSMLKSALSVFLELGNPSNEYSVTAFNQKPQVLLEGSRDASAVLAACDRLDNADPMGQTAMNDALYLSLNKLALRPAGKRVLILFSDGLDNRSKYTLTEVLQSLKESDVIVYVVGIVNVWAGDVEPFHEGRRILDELAATSGGAAFYPQTAAAMRGTLAQIADELRNQYEVTFATAPRAKGDGWHEVKFKLASELRDASGHKVKATLRTRKGFYDAGVPRKR